MKLAIGLLFVACSMHVTLSLPARLPQDDVEVIDVPRRSSNDDFNDFKGVISTDVGGGYPFLQSSPLPFNLGFFDAFEDILRRLHTRLYPSIDSASSDSGAGSDEGGLVSFDSNKANKTSTIKVVNNHKVEINDTTYGDDDTRFKIRVINIRPLDSDEEPAVGTYHSDGSFIPATAGPKLDNAEDEPENSKREPLAKEDTDNEIRGNIDDPEHETQASSTTPEAQAEAQEQTLLSNVDNVSNLNAAFVTDNNNNNNNNNNNKNTQPIASIGSGYIKTETNKPSETSENAYSAAIVSATTAPLDNTKMENFYETAQTDESEELAFVEQADATHYGALENDGLTIENNEETEQQNDDNLNESSNAAAVAAEPTAQDAANNGAVIEVIGEVDDSGSAAEGESTDNATDDVEDNEDTRSELTDFERVAAAVLADEAKEEAEAELAHAIFTNQKQREEIVSSDDEEGSIEMSPTFNEEWSELAVADSNNAGAHNDISNDIDVYDDLPIDISNDIAVNDWAAAQGSDFPLNPDAEIIDVFGTGSQFNMMPKFEKLSLDDGSRGVSYQPVATTHAMK